MQEIDVQDTDVNQVFRVTVHRVRFDIDVMLHTELGMPPAHVPFRVRDSANVLVGSDDSRSSDIGVCTFNAPPGHYELSLEPESNSAFVAASIPMLVKEDGSFSPVT